MCKQEIRNVMFTFASHFISFHFISFHFISQGTQVKRRHNFAEGRHSILFKELTAIGAFRSCGILLTCRICYKMSVSFSKQRFIRAAALKRWRNVVVHLKAIIRILKLVWYPEPECETESLKSLESMMLSGSSLRKSIVESLCL